MNHCMWPMIRLLIKTKSGLQRLLIFQKIWCLDLATVQMGLNNSFQQGPWQKQAAFLPQHKFAETLLHNTDWPSYLLGIQGMMFRCSFPLDLGWIGLSFPTDLPLELSPSHYMSSNSNLIQTCSYQWLSAQALKSYWWAKLGMVLMSCWTGLFSQCVCVHVWACACKWVSLGVS